MSIGDPPWGAHLARHTFQPRTVADTIPHELTRLVRASVHAVAAFEAWEMVGCPQDEGQPTADAVEAAFSEWEDATAAAKAAMDRSWWPE